jgi:hypothetical protein
VSRSVDLFIQCDLPLEDLASYLGRLVGAEVSPHAAGGWRLARGSLGAHLVDNGYLDDGDLDLSRYRYVLSATIAGASRPDASAEAALVRELAQKLREATSWPVLVVIDLQYREVASASSAASGMVTGDSIDAGGIGTGGIGTGGIGTGAIGTGASIGLHAEAPQDDPPDAGDDNGRLDEQASAPL